MAVRYGTPQFLLRSTVRLYVKRFFLNDTDAVRWYGVLIYVLNVPNVPYQLVREVL